ncbi:hypothetical protein OIDMADRAFT_36012 [Oidiodendron maius Zn]|uniref:Uncharacterized protein n=1 Tax=Oidiodendron maius (strain Zn) TaxID=913774 RepID=A0A0C3GP98_OIDMZ|nr:hypothetical protein OIDMADRAFT_36012 [Oidiodendron maius Zn]
MDRYELQNPRPVDEEHHLEEIQSIQGEASNDSNSIDPPTQNPPGDQGPISEVAHSPSTSSQVHASPHCATKTCKDESKATEFKEQTELHDSQVLPMPREYSLVTVTLVALVQLTAVIVLIVIIPVEIWSTTGTIKTLWVIEAAYADQKNTTSTKRKQRMEVLLGLGSLNAQFSQFQISISFMLTGLITTALVAGLTLSNATTSMSAVAFIYKDDLNEAYYSSDCVSLDNNITQGWISWPLANGSILSINPPQCDIEQNLITAISGPYDSSAIQFTLYQLNGVSVTRSAMGAPWQGRFGTSFGVDDQWGYSNFPFSDTSTIFESASQCFPILSLNPVQCRPSGNVLISENSLQVVVPDCNISTPIFAVDPRTQGATAAGVCPYPSKFGKGTILIGSTNSHAVTLASEVANFSNFWPNISLSNIPNNAYAVVCDVDIAPQIAVQTLIFDKVSVAASSSNTCSAEDTEALIKAATSDAALLYGMAGLYPLLVQNTYRDGWLDTLFTLVDESFTNSAVKNYAFLTIRKMPLKMLLA